MSSYSPQNNFALLFDPLGDLRSKKDSNTDTNNDPKENVCVVMNVVSYSEKIKNHLRKC